MRARVAERRGIATYKVYDDIKSQLHPSITEDIENYDQTMKMLYGKDKIEVKDLLRPLEKWELNPRCLKSIKYFHKKQNNLKNLKAEQMIIKELLDRVKHPD